MARSKYINTFNTTADYENYIESALPEFPNVGYDKEAGSVKITRTSPNSHIIYGTMKDNYSGSTAPYFKFNENDYQKVYAHLDTLNNTFYVDSNDMTNVITPLTKLQNFINNGNIKAIKKLNIDTTNVTNIFEMFYYCSNLRTLDLTSCDFSNVTEMTNAFKSCSSLTDVYISNEGTLMKLTNNLSSQGNNTYIPSSATIHYNDVDYKWQNNAWTAQS